MEVVFVYLALAVVVGVAARSRGRSGLGWFFLALIISPVISGLLLLALRRVDRGAIAAEKRDHLLGKSSDLLPSPPEQDGPFEADGVIKGIPYRIGENGITEAMMSGEMIRFRNMDQFLAAAEGRDAEQPQASNPSSENVTIPNTKSSILRVFRHSGYTDKLRKYKIIVNGSEVGAIARNSVVDFKVPSGAVKITARIDWCRSQPLLIEAHPGKRVEIEVLNRRGPFLAGLSTIFAHDSYLTLKRIPTS